MKPKMTTNILLASSYSPFSPLLLIREEGRSINNLIQLGQGGEKGA
jgi:hypothetical protein